jgi:hypothetical protein
MPVLQVCKLLLQLLLLTFWEASDQEQLHNTHDDDAAAAPGSAFRSVMGSMRILCDTLIQVLLQLRQGKSTRYRHQPYQSVHYDGRQKH